MSPLTNRTVKEHQVVLEERGSAKVSEENEENASIPDEGASI